MVMAVPRLLGAGGISGQIDWCTTVVGCATVAGIVAMYLCGAVVLRIYGLAIGILCGYLLSLVLGVDSAGIDTAIHSAPLFALPKWQHPGFDFDAALICPFLIAALAVSIKGSGLISQGHQINGVYTAGDRKRRMSAGLLADGTGTFLSGLLGGFGSSMSAANLGLSAASRATSRRIGYGVPIILLLLACFPKLTAALYFMPQPVMGAAMFCIGAHLIGVGVELIRTTPLGLRSILTVGFPLLVGLWIEVMPPALSAASAWTGTLFTSSISATALLVFGCHYLIFSLHRYHHRPGSTGQPDWL